MNRYLKNTLLGIASLTVPFGVCGALDVGSIMLEGYSTSHPLERIVRMEQKNKKYHPSESFAWHDANRQIDGQEVSYSIGHRTLGNLFGYLLNHNVVWETVEWKEDDNHLIIAQDNNYDGMPEIVLYLSPDGIKKITRGSHGEIEGNTLLSNNVDDIYHPAMSEKSSKILYQKGLSYFKRAKSEFADPWVSGLDNRLNLK
ncbi:MAG TPA: hypothetical protein VI564_02665 [Candidatus Nanoarchaeia archaeon]|nr:hypothetical protein [Candidatus Nanoarchaeia archaeon]